MENQEIFNIVMLPTKKGSWLGLTNGKLYYSEFGQMTNLWENQHLYAVSNEEINDNDWVLHKSGHFVYQVFDARYVEDCKKVIASTDKEITPDFWIHESFVNAFVLSYNNKKTIKEIKIGSKARGNGSVVIHPNKTYSQEEVDEMLDRQAAITTAQILKNQEKMYSHSEVIELVNKGWHNGYWYHYEEVNGKRSSHEEAFSFLDFIKEKINK